jgi:hypothetical protein
MKKNNFRFVIKNICILVLLFSTAKIIAQDSIYNKPKSEFWKKVHYGGGLSLGISNGFTNISVAPNAIYEVNKYVSLGFGLRGSYISSKSTNNTTIYGGSLVSLFNPSESIQLSADLEQLKVNTTYFGDSRNFWNTALFVGAGYRMGGVTVGAKYDLLYNENKSIYPQGIIPFVSVYF